MGINFKNLIPRMMQDTRWGDFALVMKSFYDDFKEQVIDPIKTQFNKDTMTEDEIYDMAYRLGFNLQSFDGYTASLYFLKREILTVIPRIKYKTTRQGYKYIFYCFNLIGDAYPILLLSDGVSWQAQDNYWSTSSGTTTLYKLDPTPDDTLDSDSGLWIATLDQTVSSSNTIIRHFVISFKPKYIEADPEFISLNTLKVFYTDVRQMKRATEIPYFEYRLEFDVNFDHSVSTVTFTDYLNTFSGYQRSILIGTSLAQVSTIEFGNGAQPTIDMSITGCQSPISVGGDISVRLNTDSGGDAVGFSKLNAFDRVSYYDPDDISSGYQKWGFDVVKTVFDASGLSYGVNYTFSVTIDGIVNNVTVDGTLAPYMNSVLNQIQAGLTNGIVRWDSTGNGSIKIMSLSTGDLSTVSISDTTLFASLADSSASPETPVDGIDNTTAWRSSQTGSSISGVAWIGQTTIQSNYIISKIRYRNSHNLKNNITSVKVQWKLDSGDWGVPGDVNDLGTFTVSNAKDYWNELNIPSFTPGGVYSIRILANDNLTSVYGWQIKSCEMSCTELTFEELQFVEDLESYYFYARRKLYEHCKMGSITEVAFKDTSGNCILYSTFPKIQWDEKMYGNILFKITAV